MKPSDETNNANEHNRVKNPNWREADQVTAYMQDRGVELPSTEKQLQLKPVTSELSPAPYHSATLPPLL